MVANFLPQRQQGIGALPGHHLAQPAQLLGLIGYLAQLDAVAVEGSLHGQFLARIIQGLLGGFQIPVEVAEKAGIHHLIHRLHMLLVSLQHGPVAPLTGHAAVRRPGLLGQLQYGVTVLIQLLADLPKPVHQFYSGPAYLVHITRGKPIAQLRGSRTDGFHLRLQHG